MPRALLALLAGGLAVATAPCQGSRNVELLANWNPGVRCSDVWGHVDPATGKEYALLAALDGTHVLDCSEPGVPQVRGLIPTDNPGSSQNRWRDIKTFGTHAYVVSEAYGGVQIIDLTDPDRPRKVATWGASLWSSAHNIGMDLERGIAYVCGTNTGTHVLDVATDPVNLTRMAQVASPPIHDLSIQDGLAHAANISANQYTVFDVRNLPAIAQLATITCAGPRSCHSTWPSRDNAILATCHETPGGEMIVYDISVPRLPRLLSRVQTGGPGAIVHNPMVRDRICHVSWNTEGYRAFDLSDPANPRAVGHYDTWSGPSSGFEGLWGVYALQPSGVIYGSDRSRGLFVFRPACIARRYGVPTTGDTAPTPRTFGAAWPGNSRFRIEVGDASPTSPGVVVVGTQRRETVVSGLRLLVDPAPPVVLVPLATDARGEGGVALPVPRSAPVGTKLFAQVLVQDAGAPLGMAATRGLEIAVFAP